MCPAHNGNGEISAVGRITSVLEASRDDRDAPALSELARRSGLPKTTVHRLAGELIRCGLLERADGRLRRGSAAASPAASPPTPLRSARPSWPSPTPGPSRRSSTPG